MIPIRKAKVTVVVTEIDGSTSTYETCELEVAPDFDKRLFEVGVETDEPQLASWARLQRLPERGPQQYARVNIRAVAHSDVDPDVPLYTITMRP